MTNPPGPPGPPTPPRGRQPSPSPPPSVGVPRQLPRAAAPPPLPPPQQQIATVACPYCNQVMQAPPHMAGQTVSCPHCRGQIEMPGAAFPGQPYAGPPPANMPGPYMQAPPPYGAPGGFPPVQSGGSPLSFNTSSRRSSVKSYKRKKSGDIIPMLMMIATGIWLVAMPLVYLYVTTQIEAEVAANPNKIVMTDQGPMTAREIGKMGGAAGTWAGFCCPTTFYAIAMVILLIAMAVSSSNNRRD